MPVNILKKINSSDIIERQREKVYGSRSFRNKNKGNLRYKSDAAAIEAGAIGRDRDGYAVFPTIEAGERARKKLLFQGKWKNTKLTDMIAQYAPKEDGNDVGAYRKILLKATGGKDLLMGQYSESEQKNIMDAVATHEGYHAPNERKTTGPKMAVSHTPLS